MEEGKTAVLADVRGQGAIKHIWITDSAKYGRQLLLRIYFDGQEKPAVNVPLSDFFCNADYREHCQINSLAICHNPARGMNCYFEMPYFKGFRIEIENTGTKSALVYYQIDCEEKTPDPDALYFHARFNRVTPLPYKGVHTLLDGVKGRGQYVGTYFYWGSKSKGWWGEGEIKFYIDGDTDFPTICGTGTEDYVCGACCFMVDGKYLDYSTPYAGFARKGMTDECNRAQIYFNMYRWHITDPIYFENDLRVTIQGLGWRSGTRYHALRDDISTVAYWYSDNLEDEGGDLPAADELEII